jgi:hypothetical protein
MAANDTKEKPEGSRRGIECWIGYMLGRCRPPRLSRDHPLFAPPLLLSSWMKSVTLSAEGRLSGRPFLFVAMPLHSAQMRQRPQRRPLRAVAGAEHAQKPQDQP